MRVIHLLRKYDPAQWGGTEIAVKRLLDALRLHGVTPVMYCPHVHGDRARGAPFANTDDNGLPDGNPRAGSGERQSAGIKRFKICVPVCGLSRQEKREFIALGGNVMSFDLLSALWREADVELVHTHTLGRLGGIASVVARVRGLPFVISIHGGVVGSPARFE